MQPALAFPFNDADGTIFPHLQAILPGLKQRFERAYICPPPPTWKHIDHMQQLQADDFFMIFPAGREMQLGELFAHLYRNAAEMAPADQLFHPCYLDRLAFALQANCRESLLANVDSLSPNDVPLIFQRSQAAWDTHPQNYRELEGIVTTVGWNLFGKELDYAGCYLAVSAGHLRKMMPLVKNPDLSMVAKMVFYLQDNIQTRDVDWLAWEDSFILGQDAAELKLEREKSLGETYKRLSYTVPMIETLARLSKNGRGNV